MQAIQRTKTSTYWGQEMHVFPKLTDPIAVVRQLAGFEDILGEQSDDPFFVMDVSQVVRQFDQWQSSLPRVEPFYAVKCNGDPVLMRLLARLGCGFDCASKNEIEAALQIESADRIIYANPCKTRNYIRHAAACGVTKMTFDNAEELHKLRELYPTAELILRIAVSDPTAVCQLNVKFGCDPITVAPELLELAATLGLKVIGVSFHVGSGCRDPTAFGIAIEHSRRLFDFGKTLGHAMHLLDIGGGYPGFPSKEITFEKIAAVVNQGLDEHFPPGQEVRVIAEPGRFFAGAAFTLCCNVIAKTRVGLQKIMKTDDYENGGHGFMYYINDGVYGSFNCILYDHFHPTGRPLFEKPGFAETTWSAVWGPTCDGLDLVTAQCRLPEMDVGDWMVFENMGAYTVAAGSEFNGFPRPKIYYYTSDSVGPKGFMEIDEFKLNSCGGSDGEDDASSIQSGSVEFFEIESL